MVNHESAFASATDLLKLISTKQISPVELTELYFDRIDKIEESVLLRPTFGHLGAFLLIPSD